MRSDINLGFDPPVDGDDMEMFMIALECSLAAAFLKAQPPTPLLKAEKLQQMIIIAESTADLAWEQVLIEGLKQKGVDTCTASSRLQ